jgi:hypothetical protein
MRRRFFGLFAALIALLAIAVPANAQRSTPSDTTLARFASLAPVDSVVYVAARTDDAYLTALEAVWPRLSAITGSSLTFQDFLDSSVLGDILTDTAPWRGSTIAFSATAQTFTNNNGLFGNEGFVLMIEVADRAAAEAWLASTIDSAAPTIVGNYARYAAEGDETVALLDDNVFILTSEDAHGTALPTGDFADLLDSAPFQAAVANVPAGEADLMAYIDLSTLLADANAREFTTRETTPYREFRAALAQFVGQAAVAGVLTPSSDAVLDIAWQYGDPAALEAFGIDPDQWITPALSDAFTAFIDPDAQLVLRASDLAGSYDLLFDSANALYQLALSSPELYDMFNLQDLGGLNPVGLVRGGLTTFVAAATGLNLRNDVLTTLDDTEFALTLGGQATEGDLVANASIVANHTGGAEAWLDAVAEALTLYSIPTAPQDVDGGRIVDFAPILSLTQDWPDNLPYLQLGANGTVAALGTPASVAHALAANPVPEPARFAPLLLPDAQIIATIDGASVQAQNGQGVLNFDSATASVIATPTGLLVRLTITPNP